MYNKIFTKILDSSIWLEPTTTRLVWLTLIASMDEDGFCAYAALENLSHRARVTLDECAQAVKCLEGPDINSGNKDNEGRRIERIPGGWIVLNAVFYRTLVTRIIAKERTRKRVSKHRQLKKLKTSSSNKPVTVVKRSVTVSEAVSEAVSESKTQAPRDARASDPTPSMSAAPPNLAPRLREIRSEASRAHGHEIANRAFDAANRLFAGMPSEAQFRETLKCAAAAGVLDRPASEWPDFRQRIKHERLGTASTASGSDDAEALARIRRQDAAMTVIRNDR